MSRQICLVMLATADFALPRENIMSKYIKTEHEKALETEAKWLGIGMLVIIAIAILILVAISY